MNISLYTFGCMVNNAETQRIRDLFIQEGDCIIEHGTPDAIVINSCAITSSAEKNSTQLVKRLRKKYPYAVIALVGCSVEYAFLDEKKRECDVDIALGNDKECVVRMTHALYAERQEATPESVLLGSKRV